MKSSNKLLIVDLKLSIPRNYYQNIRIRYDICLTIKEIVMKVMYEYMMTSSDQILWIFLRLNDPIYPVKLILIMLTCILLLQLLPHSVHPPPFLLLGVEPPTKFSKRGVLTGSQFLERDCWERGVTFFRGLQF